MRYAQLWRSAGAAQAPDGSLKGAQSHEWWQTMPCPSHVNFSHTPCEKYSFVIETWQDLYLRMFLPSP
jgi:hypothetical protein